MELKPNLLSEVVEGGTSFVCMDEHIRIIDEMSRVPTPGREDGFESLLFPVDRDVSITISPGEHPRVSFGIEEQCVRIGLSFENPDLGQVVMDDAAQGTPEVRLDLALDVLAKASE